MTAVFKGGGVSGTKMTHEGKKTHYFIYLLSALIFITFVFLFADWSIDRGCFMSFFNGVFVFKLRGLFAYVVMLCSIRLFYVVCLPAGGSPGAGRSHRFRFCGCL